MQCEVISSLRIGEGYDLHRLQVEQDNGLLLGGFRITCGYRAVAHSDGDALCHAVIDSLLGALALGDIGSHFPPSEERWHNANSLEMLRSVYSNQIVASGYQLLNLDCTVILEKIRIRSLIDNIRHSLLRGFTIPAASPAASHTPAKTTALPKSVMPVALEQLSIKAKTKEKLGAVGRGEAIEVFATCLLQKSAAASSCKS